ncbi:MAG: acetyl-CoA hydrolase [Deltaproteobacteria bacterium]|nr:acetyl-CoA hydrolase [Deltaproteobacteria bacterium]
MEGRVSHTPTEFTSVEDCVERAIAAVGNKIVLGAPLGLGKPNQLMNAFFRRAERDPSIELTIFTALSLEKPRPASDLEARFLDPYLDRHFGSYVELDYMRAIRERRLPPNVTVHEFYFRAGSMKGVASAQCNYISTNYTFVARDLFDRGVNVLAQLVAEKEVDGRRMLSLSSNTDVTLDIAAMLRAERAKGRRFVTVAQVHGDLPFMVNKAMVEPGWFDFVVRSREYDTTLFATPNMSVGATDFAIGFHASTLLRDGGTLQIGIGSLGDAVVYGCQLRQAHNDVYRQIAAGLGVDAAVVERIGGFDTFEKGLYGCSEMFVNGFLHLMRSGIVKRQVFDDLHLQRLLDEEKISTLVDEGMLETLVREGVVGTELTGADVEYLRHWGILRPSVRLEDGHLLVGDERIPARLADADSRARICRAALGTRLAHGIVMHGGFILGPQDFYEGLRAMPPEQMERIGMDSVRRINRLDDPPLQTLQRRRARFINSAMMVTLSGAVVSDALEDGQVVSGVGGQYNFVAQAHELPDARSIICLSAVRGSGSDTSSNIVASYGHTTIPRHLRDVVVTEYGVADLRGKSDQEIIQALLAIADSRFQDELLEAARKAGKIDPGYEIPERQRDNLPERVGGEIGLWRAKGFFSPFPLGTDFTDEEVALGRSLKEMKALMDDLPALARSLIRSFTHGVDEELAVRFLERIGLEHPNTAREVILRHLLLLELEEHGYLRPL